MPSGGTPGPKTTTNSVAALDPNALYGPTGYGAANFVTNIGGTFAYRVTFENNPEATAPAQSVTITNNLNPNLDWSTFQLTGIGFGDNNFIIPTGSQYYRTTVSITYNGQTFNVEIEAGIRSATGQVYASFYSIDPNTGLPPPSVLTGFLPPEDNTGRGSGYLTYSVSPKLTAATGVVIPNVATIVFDGNPPIATNQVDPLNPGAGTDPNKEARVAIDANIPVSQVTALPAYVLASFNVSWAGMAGTGGSGIASYTVYVSSDGAAFTPWLIDTQQTSATYLGVAGKTYSFYVVAKSNVGNVQTSNLQTAAVTTQSLTALNYWRWQNLNIPSNTGIAADAVDPDRDGVVNLLEFATNSSPITPNVMPGVAKLQGNEIEFTYTRSKAAMNEGITFFVEWSEDLSALSWSTIGVSETILSANSTVQQVKATVHAGTGGKRFVRLRVVPSQ